jgi:dolichol-phosphate mannosyltransferase
MMEGTRRGKETRNLDSDRCERRLFDGEDLNANRTVARELRTVLVAPAFNEEGKIGKVVSGVPAEWVDKVLAIDDGSFDRTPEEAAEAGAEVIRHEKRRGVGAAIRTGIEYALSSGYDIVIIIAGNGKDDAAEVGRLLKPILEEGYDYVQGSRYLPGGIFGHMPFHRRLGTRLYPLIFRLLTGFPSTDATNGFRAYKTEIFRNPKVNIWQEWLDTYELEYYIHYNVIRLGYKVKEVPVTKLYPQTGSYKQYTKSRPLTDWWRMLKPVFYLWLGIKS